MVTLDTGVVFNLRKEFNASALINRLLKSYYLKKADIKTGKLPACVHDWSTNAYSSPGGLFKECLICGETKLIQNPKEA